MADEKEKDKKEKDKKKKKDKTSPANFLTGMAKKAAQAVRKHKQMLDDI